MCLVLIQTEWKYMWVATSIMEILLMQNLWIVTVTSRYTTTYLKLNSNGEVLWVKALDGAVSPGSVYVDSEDNKYLSGHCWGSEYNFNGGVVTFSNIDGDDIVTLYCGQQGTLDAYVIKLDSSDNYVWHWNDRVMIVLLLKLFRTVMRQLCILLC